MVATLSTEELSALARCLNMAWKRLREVSGDRDIPDIISLDDIASEWPAFRDRLVARVATGSYSVTQASVLDRPKDELNVRPIVRLGLEDRLIYDACVWAMTPMIDASVPSNVYSDRWSRHSQRLYRPISRWIDMQRQGRWLSRKHVQMLLLRTDITSFYEYVDTDILTSDLDVMGVPQWASTLLKQFLVEFNTISHAWGLPQGPDASGVLSNVYLLPVDRSIKLHGLTHLRYSDDIMIFGPSWRDLRRMLHQINNIYRTRHLSLSASKTKIVEAHDVPAEFENTAKDAVRYSIDIAAPLAMDELHEFFDTAAAGKPPSVRDLKFALNQLKRIADDYAVSWLLDHIDHYPHIMPEALRYLTQFRAGRPEIDVDLSAALANGTFDLYPFVERRLIHYLTVNSVAQQKAVDTCWQILEDTNKREVRDFAARYLGKCCEPGDGARLRGLFEQEESEAVKRALLIAYFESGECPRRFCASLSQSNSMLGVVARYLLPAPEAIPCPSLELG
jgi:hypothetical protein